MKRKLNKIRAGFLAAILMLNALAPAAAAGEENVVHLRTAQDLIKLSENCTLDSWSRGKTVCLENNIDLTGVEFEPIPTFGGRFEGQGHTISGLNLTGSGDTRGLFRYIQAGGTVSRLTVTVNIDPAGRQNVLGGIAGSNSGTLTGCAVRGSVKGKSNVGGIVGVNKADGRMINCAFSGYVTGEHYVGGVAGQNLGGITQCQNGGSINTTHTGDGLDVEREDPDQLNSTENIPACTDIGGIAGFSAGFIQSCKNTGGVGYEHAGYNVGGIVGRQSGYLDGCTNTGAVRGRKDVGGIAGQLEPEAVKAFSQDFLDRLLDELDTLQGIMDRALTHADRVSGDISQQLHSLSDRTRAVKDSANGLTDAITGWTNDNIDQVNDVFARISWTLNQLEPIMDRGVETLEDLQKAADILDGVLDSGDRALESGKDSVRDMKRGLEELREGLDDLHRIFGRAGRAADQLRNALGDGEQTAEALGSLLQALEELSKAAEALRGGCGYIIDGLDSLEQAGSSLQDAVEQMGDAGDELDRVMSGMMDITGALQAMVQELADRPEISLRPIDSMVTDEGDALDEALTGLMDGVDGLTEVMDASSDTLLADMRAINGQFRAILNLIREEKKSQEEKGDVGDRVEARFEDVSDLGNAEAQQAGRISASRNEGAVAGDINVAGIAGSIALEYDFDPEDDLVQRGARSLDFRYQAKAVLMSCVNRGEVTARRDGAGGIVGRMDLGRVSDCEGYGPVASTDGSYVGGIAGACYATIRDSWAKCGLSGKDYVGGIAGLCGTVENCRALVEIRKGEAYLGAVAGDADDGDGNVVSGNLFTSDVLGGVDGISYAGKAEPVSFDDLCAGDGVPAAFTQMELIFTAEGKTVAVIPFRYGEGIESLPEVPAKKGYSAAWPKLDYTCLKANQTLEAVYTPYASALTEDSEVPEILVDGSFSSEASVSHITAPVDFTGQDGTRYSAAAVTVTVNDPVMRDVTYTVHYRLPDSGRRYQLWVRDGDEWRPHQYQVDGRYLLLAGQKGQVTFCVTEGDSGIWMLTAVVGGIVLLAVLAVLIRRRIRGAGPKEGPDAPGNREETQSETEAGAGR